jgi:hypothetical protein
MSDDKIFADGLIFKLPREGAPDFVKGSLSIRVDEFVAWIGKTVTPDNNGWLNIDLKVSKGGKAYAELNTYKKLGMTDKPASLEYPQDDINPEDTPF